MPNQFSVEVPGGNALQSLMQGYQFGSGISKERRLDAARQAAAEAMASGDYRSALAQTMGVGDTASTVALSHMHQQSPEAVGAVERAKAQVQNEFAPKTVDIKRAGPMGDTITETMERGPNGIRPLQVQGQQPGENGLPTYPTTPQAGGDEFLKTLPPMAQSIVKKVANYEINPSQLSVKGGHRENIMAAASRYDPNFDAALAPARFAAIKEFNSGGSTSPASIIVAGNTAIQHLKGVSDASQKIGGASNYGYANSMLNTANVYLQDKKNNPDLVEYNNSVGRFVEEATKFYRGVGGNESDIQRALHDITAAQSPEARNRAIAVQADLIQSKVNAMQDRWKQANGPAAWGKVNTGDFPIVQQKSQAALNEIFKRDGRRTDAPAPPGQQPPQQQQQGQPGAITKQQYDALPPGSPYTAPDGSPRIKN